MAGMSMSSIDSFVQGGAGLAETIYGTIGTLQAKKEIDKLMANYPKWEIPQSYRESMNIMGQLASGNMPGYDLAKEGIQETMAQTAGEAKEGALSSSQYQDTMAKLNQQSLKAIRDLNIQNAQMKALAQKDFAKAKSEYGDLETQQWDQNVNRLWNLKMKQQEAKKAQDYESIWAGMDTFLDSSEKFASSWGGGEMGKSTL